MLRVSRTIPHQHPAPTTSRRVALRRALGILVRGPRAMPDEGDPVVIDSIKYRVWLVGDDGVVQLRTSLHQHFASIRIADLAWDAEVGVWRPLVPAT